MKLKPGPKGTREVENKQVLCPRIAEGAIKQQEESSVQTSMGLPSQRTIIPSGLAFSTLAMLVRPTFPLGSTPALAALPHRFPAQFQSFLFREFLGKMGVVELRIALA